MNSVQRSAPIDIQNVLTHRSVLPRERHDTISRIKEELSNRKRCSSNSLSPDLSSPTPPTFIPDGTHEISQLDKYILVEHVSGHNAGNVYRTVDVNTEREYICKVYDNNNYRKSIEPYTRVPQHPHINKIVDLVQGSEKTYAFFEPGIAQQNVKNFQVENLHSHVLSRKHLDEQTAAVIFRQIVEAVSHCHEHNVVVRDLKLRKFIFKDSERSQVMMESLDDAKVLHNNQDDIMHDSHGCPAYVSPEMVTCTIASNCQDKSEISGYSGKASDIWSLGVMLYTLLVGRYPFVESGGNSALLFCKIRRAIYTIPDKLSTQAHDLIHNLLNRDVSQRFKAHEILKHPWIIKHGNCQDEPKFVMPIGFGGHHRVVKKQVNSHQQVPNVFSNISYDYDDEQLVPDSYVSEEDETMFDF